ncbi:MAG TPA: hypothetical protein VFF35_10355 [Bacteroidia bacterium]|nr:hypothetical protein [Bacteroidia bacterium]
MKKLILQAFIIMANFSFGQYWGLILAFPVPTAEFLQLKFYFLAGNMDIKYCR